MCRADGLENVEDVSVRQLRSFAAALADEVDPISVSLLSRSHDS